MKKIGNIFQSKFKENTIKKPFHTYAKKNQSQDGNVFDFLDLVNAWPKIIGKALSKVTTPLKIQHKSLYIISAHPAFSQQLSSMDQEILKKITTYFPDLTRKVTKIYFQTNPNYFRPNNNPKEDQIVNYEKKNKFNQFSPKYRKLKTEALEAFSEIVDENIKSSLVNIYVQTKIDKD